MKILIIGFTLLACTACNSNLNTTVENKDSLLLHKKLLDSNNVNEKICYANDTSKDSVILQLKKKGATATGTLVKKLFGKDVNKGKFYGLMKGDTLIADYSFFSESVLSVRQIVFLKRNNTLIVGYSEVEEKEGKMIF